jgi:hypothetical protein
MVEIDKYTTFVGIEDTLDDITVVNISAAAVEEFDERAAVGSQDFVWDFPKVVGFGHR